LISGSKILLGAGVVIEAGVPAVVVIEVKGEEARGVGPVIVGPVMVDSGQATALGTTPL